LLDLRGQKYNFIRVKITAQSIFTNRKRLQQIPQPYIFLQKGN
jgi:hypothetical protein